MTDDAVSQLLLDYARGRLSRDHQAQISEELAQYPEYLEELEYYQNLTKAGSLEQEISSPGELGWARLSRAIDAEERSIPKHAANDSHPYWRYATFALAALAIMQTAFLSGSIFSQKEPIYVSVSEKTESFDSQVIFSPDAIEADISALLRTTKGNIISGPSAIGAYTVRFSSEENRQAGIEQLRQSHDIIERATAK